MFSIIPKDTEFYGLFEKSADIVLKTADVYFKVGQDFNNREDYLAQIRQLEHDGDEITHRTLDKLDKSFITPFDREDIQALMRGMDDIIDEIDAAAKRLSLYRIPYASAWFVKQTDVLVRACRLVREAVGMLRNIKRPEALHDMLVEIHRLENLGDDNNHAAIAELYEQASDPIYVMKWKEIYDLTERAIDGCEDVANTIEAIILKNG